ncbi:MAG: hybrid sensor histidine kinase/response regulator [Methermicoccaceae archaeon]
MSLRESDKVSALLSSVGEIARQIATVENFDEMAERLISIVCRLTGTRHGAIIVLKGKEIDEKFTFMNEDRKPNALLGMYSLVAKENRSVYNNTFSESWVPQESVPKCILAAPLQVGEEEEAAIAVWDPVDRDNFDQNDLRIIDILADHVSAAVRNAISVERLKEAELVQIRANEMLRTFKLIEQLLVVERERDALLQKLCELLHSVRGYPLVWFAINEDDELIPHSYVCDDMKDLSNLHLYWANSTASDSTRVAMREGRVVVITDRETLDEIGGISAMYGGVASFPVTFQRKVYGVLSVCVDVPEVLDANEVALLEELVDDLALIFHMLEEESMRRESEELFMMLSENEALGVYLERNGSLLYVNDALASMLGYFKDDMVGRSFEEFIQPDDRPSLEMLRTDADRGQGMTLHAIRSDGGELYAELYEYTTTYREAGARVGVLVDATDKVRAEKEKLTLMERLASVERMAAVGMLAGGVAHEINNPLTLILNNIHMLGGGEGITRWKDSLSEIEHATMHIKRMMSDLVSFSKRGERDITSINLDELIEKTLSLLSNEFKISSVRVETSFEHVPKALCQSEYVMQALLNIINHSLHTLNEKYPGAHPNKKIEIWLGLEGANAVIKVKDTGSGIQQDSPEDVFESSYPSEGVNEKEKVDLGLSVAYSIMRAQGGNITVSSIKGEGTEFSLSIPVEVAEGTSMGRGRRVLVVDNTPEVRRVIGNILNREGFEVSEADCVDAAMYSLNTEPIDVVLLDPQLPGRDGMDIMRRIQLSELPVPVVLLSTKSDTNSDTHFDTQSLVENTFEGGTSEDKEGGVLAHLTKPIHSEELL